MAELWAFGLVLLSSLTSAAGPIYVKKGLHPFCIFKMGWGAFLYGIGIILFVLALFGGELSTLYPVISLTYVWVVFLGYYLLDESISKTQLFGVLAIMLGVAIMAI